LSSEGQENFEILKKIRKASIPKAHEGSSKSTTIRKTAIFDRPIQFPSFTTGGRLRMGQKEEVKKIEEDPTES